VTRKFIGPENIIGLVFGVNVQIQKTKLEKHSSSALNEFLDRSQFLSQHDDSNINALQTLRTKPSSHG